jgi:type I restriction enzyme M protein
MEQITYLLFIKRLDELQTLEERKAQTLNRPLERTIFPKGKDQGGTPYRDMRWSRFKALESREMYKLVDEHVFPFLRTLGGNNGTMLAKHMSDARFGIPTPGLLAKAVEKLDDVSMDDRDTKGDVYEYMLSKIATAGQNGQFRTPRHIIKLMVALTEPTPTDTICDPAAGTCGFLIAAAEYLREQHPGLFKVDKLRKHFHEDAFHGFDFDPTMLRIGSMNMILHGIENPTIIARDSLAEDHATEAGRYSLVLANPPFSGSLDYESTAKDLLQIVKTKKTELLFLALFIRLMKIGGRAAVIVPDGVLFNSSKAHKALRKLLVETHKLEAVISLPAGVFKPYAGVSTGILVFTKTGVGGTDHVWFYDVRADGYSLDDKRLELLSDDKLGPIPAVALSAADAKKNDLPDVLLRWAERAGSERRRSRRDQSFCVSKSEIAASGAYKLSMSEYKLSQSVKTRHRPTSEIAKDLNKIGATLVKRLAHLESLVR